MVGLASSVKFLKLGVTMPRLCAWQKSEYMDCTSSERCWLDYAHRPTRKSVKETFGRDLRTVDVTWHTLRRQCKQMGEECPTRVQYAMGLKYHQLYPAYKDLHTLGIPGVHEDVSAGIRLSQYI